MTSQYYGAHAQAEAWEQGTGKLNQSSFKNNLTRRNVNILERMPNRSVSTSLASCNIKSLRLFRNICRMVPFIITTHQMNHRFTPIQSKRFIANHFRLHSTMTNLTAIDRKIQEGYQFAHEAEWHYINTGYLSKFITPQSNKILRDHGIDRLQQTRGAKNKKEVPSGFLQSFYRTRNEQRKERWTQ